MLGADASKNATVFARDRLRPNICHSNIDKVCSDEHRGFQGGSNSHDRGVEVFGSQLVQCFHRGGVGLDNGNTTRELLDAAAVFFNCQHFVAKLVQSEGNGGTETSQSDDQGSRCKGLFFCHSRILPRVRAFARGATRLLADQRRLGWLANCSRPIAQSERSREGHGSSTSGKHQGCKNVFCNCWEIGSNTC